MTLDELIAQFRIDVQDPVLPGPGVSDDADSLWQNAEIVRYADLAQREFALRTECFIDATSFAPVVTANNPWVDLDPRIIRPDRVKLGSTGRKLDVYTMDQMDGGSHVDDDYGHTFSNDWEQAVGVPRCVVTDVETDKLRLVPIPAANDTLNITAVRYPLRELKDYSLTLEVSDPKYLDALLLWMKYHAYRKQDADAFDADASAAAGAAFRFVTAEIKAELSRKRRPVGAIRYGGY